MPGSNIRKRITVEVGRHTGGIDSSDHDTRQSAVWACGGLFEELLIGFKVRHDDSFLLVPVIVILCVSRTELARRQVEWWKDSIRRFERRTEQDEEGETRRYILHRDLERWLSGGVLTLPRSNEG